jgi:nucleoid-associated protein YgaU
MITQETPQEDTLLGDVSRTHLITAIAIFMLCVFVIALFLTSKAEWQEKLIMAQAQNPTNPVLQQPKTTSNENTIAIDKALEEAAKEATQNPQGSAESTDDLKTEIEFLKRELHQYKVADSVRSSAIANASSYKVYGFFKSEKYKTEKEVASKFHIKSEKAIKVAELNGEKAFVVPVKGTHIAKSGETAFAIAKKYYRNEKLSELITDFNGEIKAGMVVFIPFEK